MGGCAVRQVPIDMWEWVWERADEARRRRSWAKTKEGLGSKALRKHQSPPSCTSGSTAAAPRMKRVYRGKEGGMCELPKASDRLGSDRSPHFNLAHRKLLRVLLLGLDQCLY